MLERHLDGMGVGAEKAMAPFVVPLEAFHAQTPPSDWAESLVKAYVGDGIAADFYREIAQLLDPTARAVVLEVLADTGHAEFAVERVRQAIDADPRSPAGSRCGVAASSAKRSRKPRPSAPNAMRWSRCWSGECPALTPTSVS